MAYIATIEILIDVETEAEALDAVAEGLRPHIRDHNPQSCFCDWRWAEDIARHNLEATLTPIPEGFRMDDVWPDPVD